MHEFVPTKNGRQFVTNVGPYGSTWGPPQYPQYGAPIGHEVSFAKSMSNDSSSAGSHMGGRPVASFDDDWLGGFGSMACCAGPVASRGDPGMAGGYQQLPHVSYSYAGFRSSGAPGAFKEPPRTQDIAYSSTQKAFCAVVMALLVGAASYGVTVIGRHYQSQHLQQRNQEVDASGQRSMPAATVEGTAPAPAPLVEGMLEPAGWSSTTSSSVQCCPGGMTNDTLVMPTSPETITSATTTTGKYDCSEEELSDRVSSWSPLRIVWCCQNEQVACELADKAFGTQPPPPPDGKNCARYGCVEYDRTHECQCNAGCLEHNNCCIDFARECAATQMWPEETAAIESAMPPQWTPADGALDMPSAQETLATVPATPSPQSQADGAPDGPSAQEPSVRPFSTSVSQPLQVGGAADGPRAKESPKASVARTPTPAPMDPSTAESSSTTATLTTAAPDTTTTAERARERESTATPTTASAPTSTEASSSTHRPSKGRDGGKPTVTAAKESITEAVRTTTHSTSTSNSRLTLVATTTHPQVSAKADEAHTSNNSTSPLAPVGPLSPISATRSAAHLSSSTTSPLIPRGTPPPVEAAAETETKWQPSNVSTDVMPNVTLPPILALAPAASPRDTGKDRQEPGARSAKDAGAGQPRGPQKADGCSNLCKYQGANSTCKTRLTFHAISLFDGDTDACTSAFDLLVHECPACSHCAPKAAGCEAALNHLL